MNYENLVIYTITNLNVSYGSETIGFDVLKEKLEEQLNHALNHEQLEKAKEILANLNPINCDTCTKLPDGFIAR